MGFLLRSGQHRQSRSRKSRRVQAVWSWLTLLALHPKAILRRMRASSAASRLKEIVSQTSCPGCLVITSADRTRRERALKYLLERLTENKLKPSSFTFGDQGRTTIQSFLANAAELSLFEPVRCVVIRGIEKAKAAELEPISLLASKNLAGLHLILIGESLPNSPNFKKAIEKHGTLVQFEDLKGAELSRWIEKELRSSGVAQAPDEIASLVLSLAGDDVDAISRLVEKLSLYLDGSPPTAAALRELEPGRSVASDFELAEALLNPKRAATEVLIQQLLAQGSSPFMLMGLLTKTFSTLYRIRAALDRGQSQHDLKTSLGISPWLLSKYLPLARQLPLSEIARRIEALMETDFSLKDRSLGPSAAFSSLAAACAPVRTS